MASDGLTREQVEHVRKVLLDHHNWHCTNDGVVHPTWPQTYAEAYGESSMYEMTLKALDILRPHPGPAGEAK